MVPVDEPVLVVDDDVVPTWMRALSAVFSLPTVIVLGLELLLEPQPAIIAAATIAARPVAMRERRIGEFELVTVAEPIGTGPRPAYVRIACGPC